MAWFQTRRDEDRPDRIPALVRILTALAALGLGFAVTWWMTAPRPPAPPALPASCRQLLAQIATAGVSMRLVVRAEVAHPGRVWTDTDRAVCSTLIRGDFGVDLSTLGSGRFTRHGDTLDISLPPPVLVAPGWRVVESHLVARESDRMPILSGSPEYEQVHLAGEQRALLDAPERAKSLGVDAQVRATTRETLSGLLPGMLGEPDLHVEVRFDDEPAFGPEAPAPTAPTAPATPTAPPALPRNPS